MEVSTWTFETKAIVEYNSDKIISHLIRRSVDINCYVGLDVEINTVEFISVM